MNNIFDRLFIDFAMFVEGFFDGYPVLQYWVHVLLVTVPLVLFFASAFAFTTWLERKGLARIQNRPGPNRVGPFGLLQPAADGIKMLLKEDIVPNASDRLFHLLAPIIIMIPALIAIGFIPLGEGLTTLALDSSVLFFFAIGSLNTLAIFMAGWSSRNKYSLLGGMRAVAQMISYEIPLVLSAVVVIMMVGSLNGVTIVDAQVVHGWAAEGNWLQRMIAQVAGWHIFTPWGFAGFIIFFISALAEANRSPFDIPEADSEIIAGHMTEYSGFKYALFFIGEYISAFAIIGLAITLFLGGWRGPILSGFPCFVLKMFLLMGLMIWIRGTLPRLRVDQLMDFAWKFLLPLSILNIFVAAFNHFTDFPLVLDWIFGLVPLYAFAVFLSKVKGGKTGKKRYYRFAE